MRKRYLAGALETLAFSGHKMAFVSGPRQCGKTTLAKMLLSARGAGAYRTWDEPEFRRAWLRNPSSLVPPAHAGRAPLLVLDEIHKERLWKRNLKGVYDTLERPCDILVTGSARLNVHVKGSDSLLGRYYHFRLHPFSLRELSHPEPPGPDQLLDALFSRALRIPSAAPQHLTDMLAYGPFPEPLLRQDARQARVWRRNREEAVIREDLRDLSHLPDLGRVEMLTATLPGCVGSLFSVAALREDLEVSFETVRRWLNYLRELYYLFEVKSYSRHIPRALVRSGKMYLWDYAAVPDAAARFENLVACHLLKACQFWTDTGEGTFELHFLRNKEQQELDFLIVRDHEPWLPVEVKLHAAEPAPNWRLFAPRLPCRRGLQLVRDAEWRIHPFGEQEILVAGAAEVLQYFV